jgi:hypothetical protein
MARGGAFDIAKHSLPRGVFWAAAGDISELAKTKTAEKYRNMARLILEEACLYEAGPKVMPTSHHSAERGFRHRGQGGQRRGIKRDACNAMLGEDASCLNGSTGSVVFFWVRPYRVRPPWSLH